MMRKIFLTLSLFILTWIILPTTGLAHTSVTPYTLSEEASEIMPRANITGYIYKTYNGKRWKRLWSYTYNRWEEPNWSLA